MQLDRILVIQLTRLSDVGSCLSVSVSVPDQELSLARQTTLQNRRLFGRYKLSAGIDCQVLHPILPIHDRLQTMGDYVDILKVRWLLSRYHETLKSLINYNALQLQAWK